MSNSFRAIKAAHISSNHVYLRRVRRILCPRPGDRGLHLYRVWDLRPRRFGRLGGVRIALRVVVRCNEDRVRACQVPRTQIQRPTHFQRAAKAGDRRVPADSHRVSGRQREAKIKSPLQLRHQTHTAGARRDRRGGASAEGEGREEGGGARRDLGPDSGGARRLRLPEMSLTVVQQYHSINPKRLAVSPPKQIGTGSKIAYGDYNGAGGLYIMTPPMDVCFLADEHGNIKLGLPLADVPGSNSKAFAEALAGLDEKGRLDIERAALAWGVMSPAPVVFKPSVQEATNPRYTPTLKVTVFLRPLQS